MPARDIIHEALPCKLMKGGLGHYDYVQNRTLKWNSHVGNHFSVPSCFEKE